MHKVRVDKWLWSIRIFKSRTLATSMVKANNVFINEKKCKASTEVSPGDIVTVKKNGFDFQFEVVKTIGKRVGAPIAVECYINKTPIEELNKYKDWFIGKAKPEIREKGLGRPTKKERREIEEYKETNFIEFDWDEE